VKDLKEDIEEFVTDVILNDRKGLAASVCKTLFWGLSQIFSTLVRSRLYLYRKRFIRPAHIGIPVISVGNLTVGGTGKTPVVELLARTLHERGRSVVILSRGYKSSSTTKEERKPSFWVKLGMAVGLVPKPPRQPVRIVSNQEEVLLDSEEAGDEPCMLARNLKGVPVVVDKNRVRAGQKAIQLFNPDVMVLDDGMQYLKLKHRLDVVLVDRTAPFGNGHMLPRGTLREPPSHLKRASYIFLTKCDGSDNTEFIQELRRYNRTAEIVECRHRPVHFKDMHTGEIVPLEELAGKHVGALSGIAVPQSFERGLRKLGIKVEANIRFADHHRFTAADVKPFIDRCVRRDLDYIVTTEKDMVRFPLVHSPEIPILYMRVEIEILRGQEVFDKMIRLITEPRAVPPGVALLTVPTSSAAQ
jgi:tetraacyldisaccharide 4'-kinase